MTKAPVAPAVESRVEQDPDTSKQVLLIHQDPGGAGIAVVDLDSGERGGARAR